MATEFTNPFQRVTLVVSWDKIHSLGNAAYCNRPDDINVHMYSIGTITAVTKK
jgi:hypothetical protein